MDLNKLIVNAKKAHSYKIESAFRNKSNYSKCIKHIYIARERGTPYCRPKKRVSSATPKTASEMTAAEKKKKITEKKRLGQPAGKPRRVKSLKRNKKK